MKVAFLLGSLNRGGTETLLLDVFRNIHRAPFDFLGLYRKSGPLAGEFLRAAEGAFCRLSPRFPFDPVYLWRLRKRLQQEQVQIVHTQQRLDCLYAYIATRFTAIKVVQTFHGFDYMGGTSSRTMVRWAMGKADLNLFVSRWEMEEYQRQFPQMRVPARVVYNGVNFDRIKKNQKNRSPQATYCNTPLQLGSVGNFVAGRQQNSLCVAALHCQKVGLAFELSFAGKRNDKEPWRYDECVRFCAEHDLSQQVHFLGARNDVPELLTQWDAFVYATDHDTFGIAVVEAMAAGLPVFVNDHPVMREISQEGAWAVLYKTDDAQDLCQKLCQFQATQQPDAARCVEISRQVRQCFSIEKHLMALYQAYQSVLL